MGRTARHARILKNAEAAFIAAIDVYNKPTFAYREETFSVLILNAWELLLKAKVLAENNDRLSSLYVREAKKLSSGHRSKREYIKLNRAGNPMTVSVHEAISRLESSQIQLSAAIKDNLDALTEIRDNAIHYINASGPLAKLVYEIGTASVRNFLEIGKRWFKLDLAKYPLFLMPIAFVSPGLSADTFVPSQQEEHLLKYLGTLIESAASNPDPHYHVALEVKLAVQKVSATPTTTVRLSDSADAIPIALSEEDIRQRYPWDYAELVRRLKDKYTDFKSNMDFNNIRKPLMKDTRYVKTRLLDPGNPKSSRKDFYNPNIVAEFDRYYTLKP